MILILVDVEVHNRQALLKEGSYVLQGCSLYNRKIVSNDSLSV